jgi:hypothetical protein
MSCIQESYWKSGRNNIKASISSLEKNKVQTMIRANVNIRQLSRREWLKQTGIISTGLLLNSALASCTLKKDPTILLVSGWLTNMTFLYRC